MLYFAPLKSEEEINIWNNNKTKPSLENKEQINKKKTQKLNSESIKSIDLNQKIKIEEGSAVKNIQENKVFGIYDPADNDFNLNMWSSTKSEDIQASLKRLEKIKLSSTANKILERILLSFSYTPRGMNEDQFSDLKVNWLIRNQSSSLIESFLKQNKEFKSKSRVIQYLVDENISKANIKEGCN